MNFTELRKNVIDRGLCVRCGICAGVCPIRVIKFDGQSFPCLDGRCTSCGFCTQCCPGADVDYPGLSRRLFNAEYDPADLQGYTENLFVAHPVNEGIRSAGSSGGLVTGLLVYLLEKGEIDGALVVAMDQEHPYRTRGVLATTVEEIRDAAQSKYCITPSMEVLQFLRKKKEGRYAVVALPCQIHGLRKLEQVDPKLAGKISHIFGLYCNCNLNPNGHIEAMQVCDIKLDDVARFDFRGGGWPGGFFVTKKDGSKVPLHSINIKNVMNVMFRLFGSERCYCCTDALAEYADLSFGDFWAFDYGGELAKLEHCTLVSQRTERGLQLLRQASADGEIFLHSLPLERASRRILNMSRGKKTRSFVRLQMLRKKGQPIPDYHCSLPELTPEARRNYLMYRFFSLFRGPRLRRLVLRVLFSQTGVVLDRLNIMRKNIFCKYHGN